MYVDNLVTGGESLQDVQKIKSDSIKPIEKGGGGRGGGGGVNFKNCIQMNQM